MSSLRDKVCIVTGGSSGLGRSAAFALAAARAKVVITARTLSNLEAVANKITADGGQVFAVVADISNPQSVRDLFSSVSAKWGAPDVLVNNAGSWLSGPLEDVDMNEARQLMDVNFWGAAHCAQESFRRMKPAGGHIVNVISTAGLEGKKHESIYCASKFALAGFSESMKLEGKAHNIRVTSFFPGGMKTNFWDKHATDAGSYMNPDDVAAVLVNALSVPPSMVADKIVLKRA